MLYIYIGDIYILYIYISRTCRVTYNHGKLYGGTGPHIYWNPIILKNYTYRIGSILTFGIVCFLVLHKPPTYSHMRERTHNNRAL